MLFSTPSHFLVLGLLAFGFWLVGFAMHPGGRKWREMYEQESDDYSYYRTDSDDKIRAGTRRITELERETAGFDRERAESAAAIADLKASLERSGPNRRRRSPTSRPGCKRPGRRSRRRRPNQWLLPHHAGRRAAGRALLRHSSQRASARRSGRARRRTRGAGTGRRDGQRARARRAGRARDSRTCGAGSRDDRGLRSRNRWSRKRPSPKPPNPRRSRLRHRPRKHPSPNRSSSLRRKRRPR